MFSSQRNDKYFRKQNANYPDLIISIHELKHYVSNKKGKRKMINSKTNPRVLFKELNC